MVARVKATAKTSPAASARRKTAAVVAVSSFTMLWVAGSTSPAPLTLMAKALTTSTKEKMPNSLASRLRRKTSETRKCAPDTASGPVTERP